MGAERVDVVFKRVLHVACDSRRWRGSDIVRGRVDYTAANVYRRGSYVIRGVVAEPYVLGSKTYGKGGERGIPCA
jgi:hypothetical protein